MVPDARIAEVLAGVEGSKEACAALLAQALDAGGRDNVTIVLARYGIPDAAAATAGESVVAPA